MRQVRKINRQGFSLLEALLVLVVIGVILLIAIPELAVMLRSYKIKTAATQVAMHIRFARNAAVKTKDEYRIQYNDLGTAAQVRNTYTVERNEGGWKQDTDLKGVLANGAFELPSGVEIETGGMTQVTLDSRGAASGTPNSRIRLRIASSAGVLRYQVSVTPAGSVSIAKL